MTYKLIKNGDVINTIVGSYAFITAYCDNMGYTFEEVPEEPKPDIKKEPTTEEILNALLGVTE